MPVNKNFRKLKYVSGNPQNAGFCTIYTSFWGLWRPTDLRSKLFSLADYSTDAGLSTLSKVGGYFEKVGGERRAKRG
jgi:hypothetical protein